MSTEHSHDDERTPGVSYEATDVKSSVVVAFFGITAALSVFGFAFTAVFMEGTNAFRAWLDDRPEPHFDQRILPPEPRLLADEPAALAKFRKQDAAATRVYGWADAEPGLSKVRIPVEKAVEYVRANGLPVWAAPKKDEPEAPK